MKTLRQLSVASVLVLALAISASAGEIQTPLTTPTLAGEIQIGVAGQIDTTVNGGIETGLSLIESLLALF